MKKKTEMAEKTLPEWSHKVAADDIGTNPRRTSISASPQQRKDLARRLQVSAIDHLEATLFLKRDPSNMVIHVSGELKAKVTQPCTVTLEPLSEEIGGPVEGWYANPDGVVSIAKARHEKQIKGGAETELPILEEKDDPEPIMDGEIDLGELVTQFLSLAINPYPHKDGVVFGGPETGEKAIPAKTRMNPFAALKNWKKAETKEN